VAPGELVTVAFQSNTGQTQYARPISKFPQELSIDGLMAVKSAKDMPLLMATIWQ
jgi:hypothetical protein